MVDKDVSAQSNGDWTIAGGGHDGGGNGGDVGGG